MQLGCLGFVGNGEGIGPAIRKAPSYLDFEQRDHILFLLTEASPSAIRCGIPVLDLDADADQVQQVLAGKGSAFKPCTLDREHQGDHSPRRPE